MKYHATAPRTYMSLVATVTYCFKIVWTVLRNEIITLQNIYFARSAFHAQKRARLDQRGSRVLDGSNAPGCCLSTLKPGVLR